MAKLLGSYNISGNISQLIELQDEYIINGQIYDRNSMSAKGLTFAPVNSAPGNDITVLKTMNVGSKALGRSNRSVLMDETDGNVTWILNHSRYAENSYYYTRLVKITRNGKDTKIEYGNTFSNASDNIIAEFVAQDDQFVYIAINQTADYSNSNVNCIYRISKINPASTTFQNFGNQTYNVLLQETPTTLYFLTNRMGSVNAFTAYNKTSNSLPTILTESGTGSTSHSFNSIPAILDDKSFYLVKNGSLFGLGNNYFIKYYTIDVNTNTVNAVNVDVDVKNSPNAKTLLNIVGGSSLNNTSELIYHKDGDKEYITWIRYSTIPTGSSGQLGVNQSFMLTFERVSNTQLKLVSEEYFTGMICRGIITNNGNKFIVTSFDSQLIFWTWDTNNKRFNQVSSFTGNLRNFGIDLYNNILVQENDNSLSLLTNSVPLNITAKYVKDNYDYLGAPINSSINVFAQNFLGQFLSATVELTIYGPAKFSDNNAKKIQVTTTQNGSINIPIVIDDSGILKVTVRAL